jgi:hypothetical protein
MPPAGVAFPRCADNTQAENKKHLGLLNTIQTQQTLSRHFISLGHYDPEDGRNK